MQRIAGFLLVAVIAAALAWWAVPRMGVSMTAARPAQQVKVEVEGQNERTTLTSNLESGETQESLIQRHLSLYMEWRRQALGDNSDAYGDAVHEVDDRRGAPQADVPSGDDQRR